MVYQQNSNMHIYHSQQHPGVYGHPYMQQNYHGLYPYNYGNPVRGKVHINNYWKVKGVNLITFNSL